MQPGHEPATGTDPYPTRREGQPAVLRRRDPVVYPAADNDAAAAAALPDALLSAYERSGFLFLEDLVPGDLVKACQRELERLSAQHAGSARPEIVTEPDGPEVRSVFAVHELSVVFDRLARDPRLLAIARRLLGGDVYLHQARVNVKPAFRGREFAWHSDFETWHAEDGLPRMRTVSCSISLTANNPFNGPLMVIPGSHKEYIACVGATPERNYERSLKRQEVGVPDDDNIRRLADLHGIEAPTGPAGSVLFFDCNLLHASAANVSPWPRTNAFFVYNSVHNALEAPFCGLPPRPPHVASRDVVALRPWEAGAPAPRAASSTRAGAGRAHA